MKANDGQGGSNRPRVISGGDTFVAKFVISPAFLFGAALLVWATVRTLTNAHQLGFSDVALKIAANLACIPMTMWVVWSLVRVKRVALSDTSLHVSNYLREIEVPLSDVNSVTETEGKALRIVVELKARTPFGREIRFIPTGSTTPPRPHPVLAELRAAVAAATR